MLPASPSKILSSSTLSSAWSWTLWSLGFIFLGDWRDSKNMVVAIWTYSKPCLKYSYPGPNVFPISNESMQCFGIPLAAYPLPLPPNMHANSHLPGCSPCWSDHKCLTLSKQTEVNTSVLGTIPGRTHTIISKLLNRYFSLVFSINKIKEEEFLYTSRIPVKSLITTPSSS